MSVRDVGDLSTNGTREALQFGRGDVNPSEALEAEGVSAGQQLWRFEDVVVRAKANGTFGVDDVILRDISPLRCVSVSSVSSSPLLAPSSPTPLAGMPVLSPASVSLRVETS